MFNECVGATNIYQLGEPDLCDDGAELAAGSRNTVASGTVTSGENFARNYKRGGVWPEILEKIGEAVKEDECVLATRRCDQLVVGKT
jgi:hypothetical protein